MLIWYTSSDGANWNLMKSPSTYDIDWEDLDNNSYRSVTNGNLNRDVINRKWVKLALSYKLLTDDEVKTIMNAVNQGELFVRCLSPVFGDGTVSFKAYVSKVSSSYVQIRDGHGWSLSFNIVQSEVGSWQ